MKHLYTLTGNLLAETTATYGSVSLGATHRAMEESFQVGGKGINVAKMAQRLGMFSTAVCFPGGHTGDRCLAWLNARAFAVEAFRQVAETRSGWVVRADGAETTFLGRDRSIEEQPWLAAIDFLENEMNSGDVLAICGSLPGWRPGLADPLGRLLEKIAGDVFISVDTHGPPLADLLRHPIDLVKVNRDEFQFLVPVGAGDDDLAKALAAVAGEKPTVKRWVITAGSEAVFGLDKNGRSIRLTPPAVEAVSPVGCGDVLLAGLIHALEAKKVSLEEALVWALPLAAANAASPGIADFDL